MLEGVGGGDSILAVCQTPLRLALKGVAPESRGGLWCTLTAQTVRRSLAHTASNTLRHLDGPIGSCMTLRGYGMMFSVVGDTMPHQKHHSYVSSPSQSDPPQYPSDSTDSSEIR